MEYTIKKSGKFEFIEEGEGEVLLLLHGLFGALSNWKDVINKFKTNYKVVIPLLPIYGSIFRKPSVKDLASFVTDFVDHKGFENPILIGNSLGGHIALVYALELSDNYKAIVLTGSSGLFENSMGGSFPKRGNYEYIKERIEYTFYDPKTATKELVDEVFGIVNDRIKVLKIIGMSKSAMKHNVKGELHRITKPVCLIWGKDDKITPPEVADDFYAALPDSELHFIEKCGHAPMMERPLEFNVIFEKFLKRLFG